MTTQQSYEMLNGRVFWWLTAERVQTLLNARAYRNREHTVIIVETAPLVSEYADRMFLSPINSGSTIYRPQLRGIETFRSLNQYPFEERRKLRGLKNAIAEAAIVYAVPNLRDFVIRVEHRKANRTLSIVYARD